MSLTKSASVAPHRPARNAGVRPGETLTHINGHAIVDVLDYKFYDYDPKLELALTEPEGGCRTLCIRMAEGEDYVAGGALQHAVRGVERESSRSLGKDSDRLDELDRMLEDHLNKLK